jgi:hypothetical protein
VPAADDQQSQQAPMTRDRQLMLHSLTWALAVMALLTLVSLL